ncbi:MAG: family transporter, partial [Solirubrobacteraceae bacterium]|nr:family transporter [Solirubrobacteraceae bacterium]
MYVPGVTSFRTRTFVQRPRNRPFGGASGPLRSLPAVASSGVSTRTVVRIVLTMTATVAVIYLLYLVRSTLLLVFISVFLAVAMGPAVGFFRRRGLPRGASILLVYVLIAGSIVGVGLLVVPPIVKQVDQLAKDIPGYVHDLRNNHQFRKYDDKYHISAKLNEQARKLPSHLGEAAG